MNFRVAESIDGHFILYTTLPPPLTCFDILMFGDEEQKLQLESHVDCFNILLLEENLDSGL